MTKRQSLAESAKFNIISSFILLALLNGSKLRTFKENTPYSRNLEKKLTLAFTYEYVACCVSLGSGRGWESIG